MLLDGQPAPDLEMTIVAGGIRYRDQVGEIKAKTDKDGKFSVKWPQPGLYWVEAGMEDARSACRRPRSAACPTPAPSKCSSPDPAEGPGRHVRARVLRAPARPRPWRVAYAALPSRPAPQAAALAGATMGTTWSARLALPAGCAETSARQAIQAALDEVVAEMSTWEDHSDITRYNRAGPGWRALPTGFWHVLTHALALAEEAAAPMTPPSARWSTPGASARTSAPSNRPRPPPSKRPARAAAGDA